MESSAKRKLATKIVFADRLLLAGWQRNSRDENRLGVEQPARKVDEVTGFAEDGAADARDLPSSSRQRCLES